MNDTMRKFGYPGSLVREYQHWVALVRPAQVTLGSLVVAAKGHATAFGQLEPGAYAELANVTADVEGALASLTSYARINYLMLMMVDPHVHFHIFPRYEGERELGGESFPDLGWPGPPDLSSGRTVPMVADRIRNQLIEGWVSHT
ncbi:HIT family protein [Sphingomonas xanthus]|uniref:HIT family protein n=1 Tax=Sphingomonas xanthus TaxID=2594473 RepID=A0A516IU84_9SPHN|nr:HIT family protein [Sphingomonas xanthus]QDP20468.1 HIT family protein [Sphingomonas xanthus]